MLKWWSRAILTMVCAVGVAGLLTLSAAQAQEDGMRRLRGAIVTDTVAYVPLATERICGPGQNVLTPSPDGKDVLITHTVRAPIRSLDAAFFR